MTGLLLVTIFMMAAMSLLSYVYCWHDIKSGEPHIISLRQITNIMDRNRLTHMFGSPAPGYRYKLSPLALKALLKARQGFYYTEVGADSACILGAYAYMTHQVPMGTVGWFIVLAGLCQSINFAYSIWLVRRWGHQIREEMGDEL